MCFGRGRFFPRVKLTIQVVAWVDASVKVCRDTDEAVSQVAGLTGTAPVTQWLHSFTTNANHFFELPQGVQKVTKEAHL